MAHDRDDVEQILTEIASAHPMCSLGKMMGHRAVYIGKKLALCAYEDGIIVKVPREKHDEIVAGNDSCTDFAPMGRKMTGRVVLTLDDAELYMNHPLVIESLRLTAEEAARKR